MSLLAELVHLAGEAAERYMTDNPTERPEGRAEWSYGAMQAAGAEFERQCRARGLDPQHLSGPGIPGRIGAM